MTLHADIIDVDVTEFEQGTIVYKGKQALTPDTDDSEPQLGDSFQCLGLHAACAPATEAGNAEMVKLSGIGGLNEAIVGGRDTRVGPKLGRMEPGDTVLLATDTNTDVQVRCHGKRKQLVMFARKGDATSEQAFIMVDANKEKFQFIGFGGTLEFSKKNGWIMRDGSGAGFHINGGTCTWNVSQHLLSSIAKSPVLVGASGPAGVAAPGVFAMVGHLWEWLMWWLWSKMPQRERVA